MARLPLVIAPIETYGDDPPAYAHAYGYYTDGSVGAGWPIDQQAIDLEASINCVAVSDTHAYLGGWHAGEDTGCIFKVAYDGSVEVARLGDTDDVWGIAYRDGFIYAASYSTFDSQLAKYDADLNLIWVKQTGVSIYRIAIDSNGDLFTTGLFGPGNTVVRKLSGEDGSEITDGTWPRTGLSESLWGLSIDHNDNLVAVGFAGPGGTQGVELIAPDGSQIWQNAIGSNVSEAAFDAEGNVYTSDSATVYKLSAADGSVLWSLDYLGYPADFEEVWIVLIYAPSVDPEGNSYWTALKEDPNASRATYILTKVSPDGEVVWERELGPYAESGFDGYSYHTAILVPPQPDFIVDPATPPATADYDCAEPVVTAIDDCIPAPETQDGEWCAQPEPTYANPAVPWPIPAPPAPLFIAHVRHSVEVDDDNYLTFIDDSMEIVAEVPTAHIGVNLLAIEHEAVLQSFDPNSSSKGIGRYDTQERLWWWERDAGIFSTPHPVAVHPDGAVYFVVPISGGFELHRISATGTGHTVIGTYIGPAPVPGAMDFSKDGSVLRYTAAFSGQQTAFLGAIRLSDGTLLYEVSAPLPTGYTPVGTSIDQRGLRRIPGWDDMIHVLSVTDFTNSNYLVTRLFFDGPEDQPTLGWHEVLYNTLGYSGGSLGLAVTEDVAVVLHPKFGTGNDKPDGAFISCLELGDGSVRWRYGNGTSEAATGYQPLAASGNYAAAIVFDSTKFPGTWPLGRGVLLMDLTTGEEVTLGVFPWQPAYAEQIVSIPVAEDDGGIGVS